MRAGFGLLGLLVTVMAIVLVMKYAWLPHTDLVLKEGREATITANHLNATDQNGMKTVDSITLLPLESGGRIDGILVTAIVPDGPMAKQYGLQVNDTIVEVGPQRVRDIGDASMATTLILYDNYRANGPLVVTRGGQRITLPMPASASATPSVPGSPPTDAPAKEHENSLHRQLDAIQNIPTH